MQSGQGGNGLTKMGGVGGDGGSIILRAHANTTLKAVYAANLLKRYKAGNGETSKYMNNLMRAFYLFVEYSKWCNQDNSNIEEN